MNKTPDIRASGPTPDTINLLCTAEIEAAAGEKKRPRFSMMAYSGDAIRPDGWYTQVVLDLAGLKAASQQIPALLQHNPEQIVGQTDAISIDAAGVLVKGMVTAELDDPIAKRVLSHAANGFKWQVSVGANIDRKEFLDAGKTAVVNGKQLAGPLVIARAATLREVSFVAIGADSSTSAAIAATLGKDRDMNFDQWLKAKGIDSAKLDEPTKAALKAAFDAEIKASATPASAPTPAAQAPAVIQAAPASGDLTVILAEARAEQQRQTEIARVAREWLTACPDQLDAIEAAAQDAVKNRTTSQTFERQMLRESRPKPGILINAAQPAAVPAEVIEAALCMTAGLSTVTLDKSFSAATLETADKRFHHGLGLNELLVLCAEQNGKRRMSSRDVAGLLRAAFASGVDVQAGGFSTYSLPGILGNTANKFLREGFMGVEQSWRAISAIRNLRDFKQATIYSLSGDFQYEKVGPSGELKHGTADETSYTLQADTYGRMFAITRTDIINDDLGALSAVPRRIGRGGALAINNAFWTEFMDNSTFFTDARDNYWTTALLGGSLTSVLGSSGLTSATTKFKKLTDPDGKPMAVAPRILLVPVDLEVTAAELVSSTLINTGGAATTEKVPNRNVFQGIYQVVSSTYLSNTSYTGYSETAWYLMADPNDVPVIAIGFLNGRDMPVIESAEADFNVLGIQMRGYHDFGVNLQEWRGGVKMAGA